MLNNTILLPMFNTFRATTSKYVFIILSIPISNIIIVLYRLGGGSTYNQLIELTAKIQEILNSGFSY